MDICFSQDHFAACRQVLLTASTEGLWRENETLLPVPRELTHLISGRDGDTIHRAWTWALITGLGISVLIFEQQSTILGYRQVAFKGDTLHRASMGALQVVAPSLAKCFKEVSDKLRNEYIAWRQTF